MATSYRRYAGGAVTILLAAARSGASCVHAGTVGTGPNGDLVRAALAAEGVARVVPAGARRPHGRVRRAGGAHGAERSFVTTQGAERRITPESLAQERAGARRPGLRQRLLARGAHPRPAARVAGDPESRGSSWCSTRGGLRRPRSPRCATASCPARRWDRERRRGGCADRGARPARGHRGRRDAAVPGCRDDRARRAPAGARCARAGTRTCYRDTRSARWTPTAPATPTPGCCSPSGPRGRAGRTRPPERTRRARSRSPVADRTLPPRGRRSTTS